MRQQLTLRPVPAGGHVLPPLRYPYNALEPVISEETLRIHHDRHHRKYVDDLNSAELTAVKERAAGDWSILSQTEQQLAYNGSGHILHSIYWTIMTYTGKGGTPKSLTSQMISQYFSSFENFKAQFTQAANKVYASGWCVLAYNPFFRHLEILQAEKHENLTQWGVMPVLVCDIWEHAYYLTYQNQRDKFTADWWRLINWDEVENRLIAAIKQTASLI